MNPLQQNHLDLTRREFFGKSATGVGTIALSNLLNDAGLAADNEKKAIGGLPGLPHFKPKAKNIIYLFQNGAPTHVDLFDYKPKIMEMHGKPVPDSYVGNKRFSTMTGKANGKLMLAPVEPFKQRGQSGAWVSDFLPYTAEIADKICFVKSMHTDAVNHAPGISFLLSGGQIPGRPTLGAWMAYGLGANFDVLNSQIIKDTGE